MPSPKSLTGLAVEIQRHYSDLGLERQKFERFRAKGALIHAFGPAALCKDMHFVLLVEPEAAV